MKSITILFFLITLTSCAQRIRVPINRFETPETIGGGMEIEYRSQNFSTGKLSFENDQTNNPLQVGDKKEEEVKLALGISKFDLFLRVPDGSSTLIGLKIQLMGEPKFAQSLGHKLALTLATGSERDNFNQGYSMKLLVDTQDYAIIHGYRFSPNLLVYEGLSVTNYSFEGKIKNQGTLASSNTSYKANSILGLNVGVELSSLPFTFKLEYAAQKIKWDHTKDRFSHGLGFSLGAVF